MTKATYFGKIDLFRMWMAALMLAAGLLALLHMAEPARAAGFTVTKTGDTADGSCDSDCSLREAIIAANASPDVDTISVPAGTYALSIAGREEDFAARGDLDIRESVTITGAGARQTIIDANGIDRVFHTPDLGGSYPMTVNISGVTITGGVIPDRTGGGILHDWADATLNLTDSTVRGNSAAQGGGIQNGIASEDTTMTIVRSTVSGNETPSLGGGIQNRDTLTLANTTISGNESGSYGGGIYQGSGTLSISSSTIAFNTAAQPGGGIAMGSGSPTLRSTIVANNTAPFHPGSNNCYVPLSAPITSQGKNLENGTSCGFTQRSDLNADPGLKPLRNNGGPTRTHALPEGSPAIDAGAIAIGDRTDQRGVPRPFDGDGDGTLTDDIGAFELDPRGCTITGAIGNDTLVGTPRRDVICGYGGDDLVFGDAGNDVIYGDAGGDDLFGQGDNDRLDTRDGVQGNDLANGGAGQDTCTTDPGDARVSCL
jgi:CSLREA domain-containing protein